ncbi:hypothetical protein [Mycobacterium phage WXIN]|nr:hypothetical protein [Mycobacterium phage WXIN]
MTYADYIKRAHAHMDAALADGNRVYARLAMSAAQSARQRSSSRLERAECADLIHEAEEVLR